MAGLHDREGEVLKVKDLRVLSVMNLEGAYMQFDYQDRVTAAVKTYPKADLCSNNAVDCIGWQEI